MKTPFLRAVLAIAGKDLRAELRSRQLLAAMGLFFAVVGRHMGIIGICLAVGVGEFSQFAIAHVCAGPSRERSPGKSGALWRARY